MPDTPPRPSPRTDKIDTPEIDDAEPERFIPAAAAETVIGDLELARAFLAALPELRAPKNVPHAGIDAVAARLTAELGRPRKANVRRGLQRLADKGAIRFDPPAMADWARLMVTGEAPDAGVTFIPLDAVEPSPFNPRKHFDAAALAELEASLLAAGLTHAPLVRPKPGAIGVYQIAAGERRWRAARNIAERGERSDLFDPAATGLRVEIRTLTDHQMRMIALAENAVRTDPTSIEQCDACLAYKREIEAAGGEVGAAAAELARAMGRGDTKNGRRHVEQMIHVAEHLIEEGREAMAQGLMRLSHARTIARADPKHQARLVRGFVNGEAGFRTEEDLGRRRAELELMASASASASVVRQEPAAQPAPEQAVLVQADGPAAPKVEAELGGIRVVSSDPAGRTMREISEAIGKDAAAGFATALSKETDRTLRPTAPANTEPHAMSTLDLMRELKAAIDDGWLMIEAHPARTPAASPESHRALQLFSALMGKAKIGCSYPGWQHRKPYTCGGPILLAWKGEKTPAAEAEEDTPPAKPEPRLYRWNEVPDTEPDPTTPDSNGVYQTAERVVLWAGKLIDRVELALARGIDGKWRYGVHVQIHHAGWSAPPRRDHGAKHPNRQAAINAARREVARELARLCAAKTEKTQLKAYRTVLCALAGQDAKAAEIAAGVGVEPRP